MAYGTVKTDTIIFDQGGADQNVTVSGIYRAITSGVTVTGTISGAVLIGTTTVSGATVTGTTVQGISGTFTTLTGTTTTGTTANFASGVFTTRVSGTTITGTTAQFTSGTFVSLTGTTITGTTISGTTVSSTTGTFTSLTGTTTTGITVNFTSGVFTTQVSGATVTGTQSSFTSGNFVTLSGATATFTSGVIASGTAAAPSLSIISDPNTGIYSPGADQVAISTNGTGHLVVDASGSINLNWGVPRLASIFDNSFRQGLAFDTASRQLQIFSTTSDSGGSIGFYTRNGAGASDTDYGTERMRVTSGGLVGIGTSSPSHQLDVVSAATSVAEFNGPANATVEFKGSGFVEGKIQCGNEFIIGSTNNYPVAFVANGTERLRIDSSGNVGIGTSSPTELLNVNGNIELDIGALNAPKYIKFRANSDGTGTPSYGGITWYNFQWDYTKRAEISSGPDGAVAAGYLAFSTGSGGVTERMRVSAAGNVGIGTTSPSSLLHLGAASGTVQMQFNNGGTSSYIGHDSGFTGLDLAAGGGIKFRYYTGTVFAEAARVDTSGRLLVGTSTARGNFKIGPTLYDAAQQLEAGSQGFQSFVGGSPSASGPYLMLAHQRSGTVGGNTVLVSGDEMGTVSFHGGDGTNLVIGAAIKSEVDGTPGANDMPGRLVFSTTADGAASPTERMRITSGGNTLIGGTLPSSPNAEIRANGQFRCLDSPLPQSKTYLKYSGGATARTLDVAAEINAMIAGGATWSQALVTLRGFDGGAVGYWHGIYSNGPAGGGVRATQIASSGEITLTINGGQLDWAGTGTGQWYNTYITITLGAF